MRNASHRSICRLRRAARRVGGHRRGWRGETLARGAPFPAPLLSCALGKMLSLEPPPGHSLPQSWIHTTFCSISGVHLPFGALASLYSSVHLLHSVCLSFCVGPPVFLYAPLSYHFGFVACFFLSVGLSTSVYPSLSLPFSLCLPVPPAPLCHLSSFCLLPGFSSSLNILLLSYISLFSLL